VKTLLEIPKGHPKSTTDLRDLPSPENEEGDDNNNKQFYGTYAEHPSLLKSWGGSQLLSGSGK